MKNEEPGGILKNITAGLAGFVKGQLILLCISFVILTIGLSILDMPVPALIALGIAIVDMVPAVGSGLVMIPWAIICLISGNTQCAWGIAILFLILTVSRQVLEPIIIGKKIGVRPIYTFLSSITGSLIFGPVGLIIGPVVAIVISSVIKQKRSK